MHGVQHSETEINAELQSRLSGLGLDSVAIFEQQNSKAVKTRVLQRETIFGLIHPEAARAARTRGEENVVIQNVLAGETLLLQKLEILHEISDGEVRWIALTVIAKLLPRLEARNVRDG